MTIDPKDILYTLAILLLGFLELRSKNMTSDAAMIKATADALEPLRTELNQVRADLNAEKTRGEERTRQIETQQEDIVTMKAKIMRQGVIINIYHSHILRQNDLLILHQVIPLAMPEIPREDDDDVKKKNPGGTMTLMNRIEGGWLLRLIPGVL
jgi:hypothetical protein